MSSEVELERMIVRLLGDSMGFEQMLRTAQTEARRAAGDIEREATKIEKITKSIQGFGTTISGFGRSMRSVGAQMSMMITAPLAGMGTMATHMSIGFETALQRLVSLVGFSGEEVQGLRGELLALAQESGKAPAELVATYEAITSGGLKGKAAMEALVVAAKASSIGMGDAATVGRTASLAMTAYGEANLGAVRATEILRAAAEAGNAEASQFAPVMGRLLPVAEELGIEFEEVAGSIAYMTRMTGDAALAATGLSGMMGKLQGLGLSKDVRDAIGESGLEDIQKTLADQGIQAALENLMGKLKGKGLSLMDFFTDKEALNAALMLTGDNTEALGMVLDSVKNSAGQIDEKFKAWEQTMGAQMAKSMAQFQALLIEIGGILAPVVSKLTGWGMSMVQFWNKLSPEMKEMAIWVAAVAAAAGPLITGFGTFFIIVGGAITAVITAFSLVFSWAGAAMVAVAGLVVVIASIYSEDLKGYWDSALAYVQKFTKNAIGFFTYFRENMSRLYNWLSDNWWNLLKDMGNMIVVINKNMLDNWKVGLETLMRLFIAFEGWLAQLYTKVFTVDFLNAVIEGVVKVAPKLAEFAIYAKDIMEAIWNPGKKIGEILWNAKDFGARMMDDVLDGMDSVDLMGTMGQILAEQAEKLKSPLEGFESTIQDSLTFKFEPDEFEKFWALLKQYWAVAKDVGKDIWDALFNPVAPTNKKIVGPSVIIPVEYEKLTGVAAGSAEALSHMLEYESLRPVVIDTTVQTKDQQQLGHYEKMSSGITALVDLAKDIGRKFLEVAGSKPATSETTQPTVTGLQAAELK